MTVSFDENSEEFDEHAECRHEIDQLRQRFQQNGGGRGQFGGSGAGGPGGAVPGGGQGSN